MRFTVLAPLALLAGCSEGAPSSTSRAKGTESLESIIADVAQSQAQGLKGAQIAVPRAYVYGPISGVTLEPLQTIIAVELDIRNPTPGFDPDDVDAADSASGNMYENLAWVPIDEKGTFLEDFPEDFFKTSFRCAFLYKVPKDCGAVHLHYWKVILTPQPIALTGQGPRAPWHR